jgi:thiamine kinase-like enzyme
VGLFLFFNKNLIILGDLIVNLMLHKLICLENLQIGTVHFSAFVVNLDGGNTGFALFINQENDPIFIFRKEKKNEVSFHVNEEQFFWIVKNSQFTPGERQNFFAEFVEFLRLMEEKVSNYVFKREKLIRFTNSRDIVRYKYLYLTGEIS